MKREIDPNQDAELSALAAMRDDEIDTSDAPEVTDWSRAERAKFYRPVKKQVTLRIDADVLHWFRTRSDREQGYQTRINAALRQFVEQERQAG